MTTLKKPVYISSTPVIYKDPQGGATVLFGVWDKTGSNPALYGYDPVTRNGRKHSDGNDVYICSRPQLSSMA